MFHVPLGNTPLKVHAYLNKPAVGTLLTLSKVYETCMCNQTYNYQQKFFQREGHFAKVTLDRTVSPRYDEKMASI